MPVSDDLLRDFFRGLRRDGRLDLLRAWLLQECEEDEQRLRKLLREEMVVSQMELAKIQAYQGRLSTYAKLLKKIDPLAAEVIPAPPTNGPAV